jgi:hypothetical protein
MVLSCFYPTLGTIEALANEESIVNLGVTHVTDFSGKYLVPRSSFLGRALSIIRAPLEYYGVVSSDSAHAMALHTAQVSLEQFKDYLLNPTGNPDHFIETFLSVSYNDQWPNRFSKAYHHFHPDEKFPSMDRALCLLAPKVLEQVTASPTPVEALECLLLDRPLVPLKEQDLLRWIDDVGFYGKAISQKLLFSFMQFFVNQRFPEFNQYEKTTSTFYLAWRVYEKGMRVLIDDHPPLIREESKIMSELEGSASIQLDGKLPLEFPLDFALTAYGVEGHADVMLLHSPSPISLGVWAYKILKNPTCLPYINILHMDEQGRFYITERIADLLDSPDFWEKGGADSNKNLRLCRDLGKMVFSLCQRKVTYEISKEHLFLSQVGGIGTLKAFKQKFNYLHLPAIEKLIHSVCLEDKERIRLVLNEGRLFEHPICVALRQLILKHSFQATERHIQEALQGVLGKEGIAKIVVWHAEVQDTVRYAVASLGSSPSFSSKKQIDHLGLLAEAFCALQQELGFVLKIPHGLSAALVSWVESHCGSSGKRV